ncbi:MAG: class I SAM-dependent RNA methyltransferase [Spirochaetales bacterium]|nr:class I SAM-dependent RNA methyltransferase [Spirochaetales bacterium]
MKYEIESLSSDGKGIVKINEKVHFAENTCPGDIIEPITIENKNSFGLIKEYTLIEKSSKRVTPPCKYFAECGGCSWQHIGYESQLEAKSDIIKSALTRIGKISGSENLEIEVVPSPKELNYRNRTVLHTNFSEGVASVGFYKQSSNQIIDIDKCMLLEEAMEKAPSLVKEKIISEAQEGKQDYAVFLDFKGNVKSNIHDKDTDFSFSQVNTQVNELLQKEIEELVKESATNPKILDLYCGNGNLSINLAPYSEKILGYDLSNKAISRANNLANKLGYSNASYKNADISKIIKHTKPLKNFDIMILDPPRDGAKSCYNALAKLHIPTLIYVSCKPATLARDIKEFQAEGYKLKFAKGFDMFPQTPHVETVVVLQR